MQDKKIFLRVVQKGVFEGREYWGIDEGTTTLGGIVAWDDSRHLVFSHDKEKEIGLARRIADCLRDEGIEVECVL